MSISICICLAAFVWLLSVMRQSGGSFGLPIAYLFSLLLIHVPGAFAHLVTQDFLPGSEETERGIFFTAIGAVSFVVGVMVSTASVAPTVLNTIDRSRFCRFCLFGGWLFIYGLSPFLSNIPTLAAAVEKGGAIWMVGVLIGLRTAVERRNFKSIALWVGALMIYPALTLLLAGFLSYGATAVIIVGSGLAISAKRFWRVLIGTAVVTFLALTIFVNYAQHRNDIRSAVWRGESLGKRIDSVLDIANDFQFFSSANPAHLAVLDIRLNQNYFVGVAAERIDQKQVDYLYGRSVWEGLLALVPRALWPDKPVFGGSGDIVRQMTGLRLAEGTSWGVGQVMEFQINFGIPGLIVGFLVLGGLLGILDHKAAAAERSGNLGRVFLFFLPGVALIQPNGSMVELCGGAGAALAAAYGWRWAWERWSLGGVQPTVSHGSDSRTSHRLQRFK